jgi:hypothetical protein
MHQISKIYFVIKLYMFRASSVPIIRSYLLYTRQLVQFMQVFDDRFLAESGWNCSSILTLETVFKKLHETYQCRMYGRELLMMGTEDARNMSNFMTK